jgi:hypothetical protein
LLLSLPVLGVVGIIGLGWTWAGLGVGIAGLVVATIANRRTRRAGFLAPLGFFVALTLMEAWQLWRLRGDTEVNDPLLFMGLLAGLLGLLAGGIAANVLRAVA